MYFCSIAVSVYYLTNGHCDYLVCLVVIVVVAPPPRIFWIGHPLTPQRSQSRFPLLDYLCSFKKLFPQTSCVVLCWYLTAVKEMISVICVCVTSIRGIVACKYQYPVNCLKAIT